MPYDFNPFTGKFDSVKNVPLEIGKITLEPTGFPNRTDSSISFSDSGPDRTFTITPTGASFEYYSLGKKYKVTSADSVQITDTEGLWFFYYESDGVLTASQTPWTFGSGQVFISYGYWDVTNSSFIGQGEERHGLTMDGATHAYLHTNFGAQWVSGMTPSVTIGTGSSDADAEIQSVSSGQMNDEDINFSHPIQTSYDIWYKDGASNWRKTTSSAAAVDVTVTRPNFNEFTGGVWQRTEVSNTNFTLTHLFATDDINMPYILVMGENEYTTAGQAQDAAPTEISSITTGALPITEFTTIATFIIECRDSFSNSYNARLIQTSDGGDFIDFRFSEITGTAASTNHHGNLTGLAEDDHTQYILADGTRPIQPTVDTTTAFQFKDSAGNVDFNYDSTNGFLGFGTDSPAYKIDVNGDIYTNADLLADKGTDSTNFFIGGGGNTTMTGDENVAVGFGTLGDSTIGVWNTAVGFEALTNNTNGRENTAVGNWALYSNINGSRNAVVGNSAMWQNISGDRNMAFGRQALAANTTGNQNVAIGDGALDGSNSSDNVAVGTSAGDGVTGDRNFFMGERCGVGVTGSDNIFIGNEVAFFGPTVSDELWIDNSGTSTPLIHGDFANDTLKINGEFYTTEDVGIRTTSPSGTLHIVSPEDNSTSLIIQRSVTAIDPGIQFRAQQGVPTAFFKTEGTTTNDLQIGTTLNADIRFYTNSDGAKTTPSNERMAILGNGNVGIGTTSPTNKLEISHDVNEAALRITRSDTAGNTGLELANSNGVQAALKYNAGNNALDILPTFSGTSVMSVDFTDGNVGIGLGADNPSRRLKVFSGQQIVATFHTTITSPGRISVNNANTTADNKVGIGAEVDDLLLFAGGLETVRIDETGNVGIGETNPLATLHVVGGNIRTLDTKTADYTLTADDYTILADATNNTVTITLPVSPNQGQIFNIKCIDSTNTCTIARNGNNIDGAASDINLVATDSVTLQYDTIYGWALL